MLSDDMKNFGWGSGKDKGRPEFIVVDFPFIDSEEPCKKKNNNKVYPISF